jgi:hypothetical protein
MKKNIIAWIVVTLVVFLTLTLVPLTLNADMDWKSATEEVSLNIAGNQVHYWSNPEGENVSFVIVSFIDLRGPLGERQGQIWRPEILSHVFSQDGGWGQMEGAPIGYTDFPVSVSGIGTPNISTTFNFELWNTANNIVTIEYRWGQSIRTSELVCQRVWVNEKGNFQFVFWYAYRDNNWVKIYDMSGKEVYSINMPYDNPQFEVSLPDGMYTVKTFSIDQVTPIQTFIIGK